MKQSIKTAVILAGGEGTRLRPLTNNIPKPMVRVLGKPILQWVIEWLKNNEVRNIVIGVAYQKESVIDYFKDGSKFGVRIKYSVHAIDGETGEENDGGWNMARVLVTGVTGFVGSILAKKLVELGYRVFGVTRHCASRSLKSIEEIFDNIVRARGKKKWLGAKLKRCVLYQAKSIVWEIA